MPQSHRDWSKARMASGQHGLEQELAQETPVQTLKGKAVALRVRLPSHRKSKLKLRANSIAPIPSPK